MNTDLDDIVCIFYDACKFGHLKVAQRLYLENPDFNNHNYDDAFRYACEKGHLHVAQWFLKVKPDLDVSVAFWVGCWFGHLQIAQWVLALKPDLDISADNDNAFRGACCNGHLLVAQWLLTVKPDLNISADNECAFRMACAHGHLQIAQWLLTEKPDLDISADNEYAFRIACSHPNHLAVVAQWLASLRPDKYQIISYSNNKIQYKIVISLKIVGTYPCLEKEECGICRETVCEVATECNHLYCRSCISNWLETKSSCPTCRRELNCDKSIFRQLV